MSMRYQPSHHPRVSSPVAGLPQACAKILGEYIHSVRLRDGRPLEQIAPLAGLTVPEWQAIEAGEVPAWEAILLMVAALRISRTSLTWLGKLYAEATKQ